MYVCFFFFLRLFIYLFPTTEPTVGPRCVARKQCPMATAEAHASTRTFLWKKQDKPVQCKSKFTMPACFFFPPPLLCHYVTTHSLIHFRDTCHRWIKWHYVVVTQKIIKIPLTCFTWGRSNRKRFSWLTCDINKVVDVWLWKFRNVWMNVFPTCNLINQCIIFKNWNNSPFQGIGKYSEKQSTEALFIQWCAWL